MWNSVTLNRVELKGDRQNVSFPFSSGLVSLAEGVKKEDKQSDVGYKVDISEDNIKVSCGSVRDAMDAVLEKKLYDRPLLENKIIFVVDIDGSEKKRSKVQKFAEVIEVFQSETLKICEEKKSLERERKKLQIQRRKLLKQLEKAKENYINEKNNPYKGDLRKATEQRVRKADNFAISTSEKLKELIAKGIVSERALAAKLNEVNYPTARGDGRWHKNTVRNIIKRIESLGIPLFSK